MNAKTAKLLNKTATAMAFQRFQETEELPDKDKIYKNLKRQWNGTSAGDKAKSRRAMKTLVYAVFRKPSGDAGDAGDADA